MFAFVHQTTLKTRIEFRATFKDVLIEGKNHSRKYFPTEHSRYEDERLNELARFIKKKLQTKTLGSPVINSWKLTLAF